MNLTDEQKQKISAWIASGTKLSDIQSMLGSEFAMSLTYMETRLLVDDLKLTPKDPEPEKSKAPEGEPATTPPPMEGDHPPSAANPDSGNAPAATGGVAVSVDALARPGTMVSGSVTFSDKKRAVWYLDQTGRLGVVPDEQGYRPPEGDIDVFQTLLDRELQKLGY